MKPSKPRLVRAGLLALLALGCPGCITAIVSTIAAAAAGGSGIVGCEVFRATPAEVWSGVADALKAERFRVPARMATRTQPGMAEGPAIRVWVEPQGLLDTRAIIIVEEKANRRNEERTARVFTALRAELRPVGVHCGLADDARPDEIADAGTAELVPGVSRVLVALPRHNR